MGEPHELAPHQAFDLPELMRPDQVAAWLGVTVEALYKMVERAEIPPESVVRLGRRLRFDAEQLRAWLTEKRGPRARESA